MRREDCWTDHGLIKTKVTLRIDSKSSYDNASIHKTLDVSKPKSLHMLAHDMSFRNLNWEFLLLELLPYQSKGTQSSQVFMHSWKKRWIHVHAFPKSISLKVSAIKWDFFQVVSMSVLLYGCTTLMLTKHIEKKLERKNKNAKWQQHLIKHLLYSHLTPISQTIQLRWTRHTGHCWRSKNKFISDILLWTPPQGCTNVCQPAKIYISCVWTQYVVYRTCPVWPMDGTDGLRESGSSMLSMHNDDDGIIISYTIAVNSHPRKTTSWL